jgi:phosphoglycerate dehydrogenase-like enzyme
VRIGSFIRGSFWTDRLESLRRRFPSHEIIIDSAASRKALSGLDAILGGRLDREIFEAATSLKAVFVPFTGLNHLPRELLLERGVRIFNVHGNAEAVAERALAMTLAFFGRLVEFHNALRGCQWHGFWVGRGHEDEWNSIYRRRCAILGTGAIGSAM